MSTRIPLILVSARVLHISNTVVILLAQGTSNMGAAGRGGISVSSVDTAQELIDVFSEQYRELDSARIYGDGTTEEVPFRLIPKAVSDTCRQIKFLSKLNLRGGSIDTKCERDFP